MANSKPRLPLSDEPGEGRVLRTCQKDGRPYYASQYDFRRVLCRDCDLEKKRERVAARSRTPEHREWVAKNRERINENQKRYSRTGKFKQTQQKFLTSPKGRAFRSRVNIRRAHYDQELFADNVLQMNLAEPYCAMCHQPWHFSFQCDHIIPLALCRLIGIRDGFNPDSQANLQCLCRPCHKEKSARDKRIIMILIRNESRLNGCQEIFRQFHSSGEEAVVGAR